MFGLRKLSNSILIVMSEGALTVSSMVAVTSFCSKHQWRRVPLPAHPLQHIVCRMLNGHSDQCDVMPWCSLDLHFSNV